MSEFAQLLAAALQIPVEKFDPDQARDESGKWTVGGSGKGGSGAGVDTYLGANPLTDPDLKKWAEEGPANRARIAAIEGPERAALDKNLLAIGGHGVSFQEAYDAKLINGRGQVFTGPVVPGTGKNGYCHWNVAALMRKKEIDAIGTGYVLDQDKLVWRQHSWGFKGDKIVETTSANMNATGYFGVRLTQPEAKAFMKKIGSRP